MVVVMVVLVVVVVVVMVVVEGKEILTPWYFLLHTADARQARYLKLHHHPDTWDSVAPFPPNHPTHPTVAVLDVKFVLIVNYLIIVSPPRVTDNSQHCATLYTTVGCLMHQITDLPHTDAASDAT